MKAFFSSFKEVAERETRSITLLQSTDELPANEYALIEYYCDEPGCDCRRVIFQVWAKDRPGVSVATFNYGWESEEFYTRWMHGDRQTAKDMCGLTLEPFGPQSKLARALLALVQSVIITDAAYVDRLKRHYRMVKGPQKGKSDVRSPRRWLDR